MNGAHHTFEIGDNGELDPLRYDWCADAPQEVTRVLADLVPVRSRVLDVGCSEIMRTLKPGGAHIFTVPWFRWNKTLVRASVKDMLRDLQSRAIPAVLRNDTHLQSAAISDC